VEKYGTVRQTTDDNIIRRMRFACWITKATDTHSDNVILTAFPRQPMVTRTRLNVTFIHTLPVLSVIGSVMAKEITRRRRPLTAFARVRSQFSLCEICGEQSGSGTVFSSSKSDFPRQYHSANALCTYLHLHVALTRRKDE
jgi:hypothetical protein